MRRRSLAFLAFALVFVAGCAGATAEAPSANVGFGGGVAAPAPADAAKRDASTTVSGSTPQNGIPTLAAPDRDLIMTASVSFRAQDPWATADKVRAIAAGLGGDLLALSQTGSGEQRNALVTIRVPSSRFDDALGQLKQLDGEVVTSNVDAKDVTDQFVDLQAR